MRLSVLSLAVIAMATTSTAAAPTYDKAVELPTEVKGIAHRGNRNRYRHKGGKKEDCDDAKDAKQYDQDHENDSAQNENAPDSAQNESKQDEGQDDTGSAQYETEKDTGAKDETGKETGAEVGDESAQHDSEQNDAGESSQTDLYESTGTTKSETGSEPEHTNMDDTNYAANSNSTTTAGTEENTPADYSDSVGDTKLYLNFIQQITLPKTKPRAILKSSFLFFTIVNIICAYFATMDDCDEVYNYWEPLHFLLFGKGMQTWEYSPNFALRSYLYLGIYKIVGSFLSVTGLSKMGIFYALRIITGILCAFGQSFFYETVYNYIHPEIANSLVYCLAFSAGNFISSTALLPNTMSMIIVFFIYGYWFRQRFNPILLCTVMCICVAWPFALIIILPALLYIPTCVLIDNNITLNDKKIDEKDLTINLDFEWAMFNRIKQTFICGFISLFYFVPEGAGPELYGTSPFYFYFFNCLLNFNVFFLLAIISFPLSFLPEMISRPRASFKKLNIYQAIRLKLYPFYWAFVFFSIQAHKEERFLFTRSIIIVLFLILSASRILAVTNFYDNSKALYELVPDSSNLCLSNEWYRFPSHFYLQNNSSLVFLREGFHGLLPKYFIATNETSGKVNYLNREELDQYGKRKSCDFFITETRAELGSKGTYADEISSFNANDLAENFTVVNCISEVDAAASQFPYRSFYIFNEQASTNNSYSNMNLRVLTWIYLSTYLQYVYLIAPGLIAGAATIAAEVIPVGIDIAHKVMDIFDEMDKKNITFGDIISDFFSDDNEKEKYQTKITEIEALKQSKQSNTFNSQPIRPLQSSKPPQQVPAQQYSKQYVDKPIFVPYVPYQPCICQCK
ncbi:hypothetical protein ROZALSC1DRAFT_29775 [Rozella allomycis CSF55]|uniref:Mannosyltransferase n=1 Tax=Rozella allomycis (strain CSF55) TaxID=988480 RepID=A0A075AUB5_ROZAC|nr:GPI mannosyltransferase domain-containing protein [Rozella allomycis CSF55]RKP18550.1 hypothetical protein ROZALSC1DRAFT_29775 [Rozella allomycis CSF55]|eukprot:EPZ33863.1 GPI mannosyltransferase domain-containing protein [Rozella allomycis CSF55]